MGIIDALKLIATMTIFGKNMIFITGILTFISLVVTATIGMLNLRGNHIIPFKWHPRVAKTSLGLALLHAILAISLYL